MQCPTCGADNLCGALDTAIFGYEVRCILPAGHDGRHESVGAGRQPHHFERRGGA